MTPLATLLSLALPGCRDGEGPGFPPAADRDLHGLVRPRTPNHALAAPAAFRPIPDLSTRAYTLPAPALFSAACDLAGRLPRWTARARFEARLRADFTARSRLLNFPDLVSLQALALSPQASTLVLWSRSLYGRSDLGANRRRISAFLASLDEMLQDRELSPSSGAQAANPTGDAAAPPQGSAGPRPSRTLVPPASPPGDAPTRSQP